MTPNPDPLSVPGFMDEGEPPRRRSGCSVLPYLVLVLVVAWRVWR